MTNESSDNWAFGGIYSEDGKLARPLEPNFLVVPGVVEIKGGKLIWEHERVIERQLASAASERDVRKLLDRFFSRREPNVSFNGKILTKRITTHPSRVLLPGPTLLEDFVNLAEKPDEAIREYAQRWGVLGICKHGLPRTHSFQPGIQLSYCDLLGFGIWSYTKFGNLKGWEPLSKWRYFSQQARAVLDIAAGLHQGNPVLGKRKWQLVGLQNPPRRHPYERLLETQAFTISIIVNSWLNCAAIRPFFSWGGGRSPSIVLRSAAESYFTREMQRGMLVDLQMQGITLFGALAVQLLMAVNRSTGLALCSGCGIAYAPKRRPSPGRRRYCPNCGLKAAWRDAQSARRARQAGRSGR